MNKINPGDYHVILDDNIGIVYSKKKGRIKTTSPSHAQIIKQYLNNYMLHNLSDSDEKIFEDYLQKQFADYPDESVRTILNLNEQKSLRKIEILLTNSCNLNCKYCYAHGGTYNQPSEIMTPENIVRYLSALLIGRYNMIETVMFFGGEPTLVPDTIVAICEFFQQHFEDKDFFKLPVYTMVTNGTLIDKKMAKIIQKYNIRVTISLDGPQEINDQLRVYKNGHGTYAAIKKGFEALKNEGVSPRMVEATYTSLHASLGYSKKFIHDYIKNEFHVPKVLVADCTDDDKEHGLAYLEPISEEFGDDSLLAEKVSYQRVLYSLTQSTFCDMYCDAGLASFIILPNGDIYPCHLYVNHLNYRIARFSNNGYDYSEYKDFLSHTKLLHKTQNPKCMNCWASLACSECGASLIFDQITPARCNAERKIQEKIILDYVKKHISCYACKAQL